MNGKIVDLPTVVESLKTIDSNFQQTFSVSNSKIKNQLTKKVKNKEVLQR